MLLSTVNNYYHGNDKTKVWVELYRKIQGLSFDVQCAVEIMYANTCAFVFYKIGKKKWLSVRQSTGSAKLIDGLND